MKVIPEMSSLNNAESGVKQAEINLEQTRREYERTEKLYRKNVITLDEFEKAETQAPDCGREPPERTRQPEIVRDGIVSRNAEISNTQIRSTIDGMILDIPVKVGNSVIQSNTFNDGTTIAVVADMNDMIFRGKVDETDVGKAPRRDARHAHHRRRTGLETERTAGIYLPEGDDGQQRHHVRSKKLPWTWTITSSSVRVTVPMQAS